MDPRDVLTRPGSRPDAVLRYGDHAEHLLDVHLPADAPAPTVFLVHGGFWRQHFDRTHTRPLAEALAAEGWGVVTPEYRRTGGDGGRPQTFDDVAAAFAHLPLLEEVAPGRLHLDEVTLLGHSAGGHLAMWLALRPDRPRSPRVRKVVALAPVSDLHEAHARDLGDGAVAALMGGGPDDLPQAYASADPARMLPGSDRRAPVTVLHGDRDDRVPVEMSRALRGVEYVELAGVDHFAPVDPLSAAWPAVLAALR
ncbi:MAG: alpha/beta hydrolase [Actinomycetota bacterium]|nr:alpha/beta hydrolase [Actinomycetota bacterium]